MGAGKTTVGLALAHRLGWRFVDLDDVVEEQEGSAIEEIFRVRGEAGFRQAEKQALLAVLAQPDVRSLVLAVGGGAFVQPENAAALQQAGLRVVFLDASADELRRRCTEQGGRPRPLLGDEPRFRQLYEQRRASYMKADLRVETTGLDPGDTAAAILRNLKSEGA